MFWRGLDGAVLVTLFWIVGFGVLDGWKGGEMGSLVFGNFLRFGILDFWILGYTL